MDRWKLSLEYDGTGFCGWQVQPGQRSVQGVVEEALAALLGESVRVSCSGRTDAGVHAWKQVVAFSTSVSRPPRALVGGLNGFLPKDVACWEAERVPEAFDPRRWAVAKRYRYIFLDRPVPSPLRRNRSWHVRHPLDVEAMNRAAAWIVGCHDFTSFRATGCAAAHPVRTVQSAAVSRRGDEVRLEVVGQGFLRHMVRILAGTIYEVGAGRRAPIWVKEVLEARDRAAAGRTAPPHGLYLVDVSYGDGPPPWLDGG